jgi:hypothetical protein
VTRPTLALAALLLGAAPAHAATMQAEFAGTLSGGFDLTALFGTPAPGDMAGLDFRLSLTYDTDVGLRATDPGTYDQILGGTVFGAPAPYNAADLTINGVSWSLGGDWYSYLYASRDPSGPSSATYQLVFDFQPGAFGSYRQAYVEISGADPGGLAFPAALDRPYALAGIGGSGLVVGSFGFFDFDAPGGRFDTYTYGFLDVDSARVSDLTPAPVPLPAGGGLFLVGLAALAAAGRRRAA